MYLITVTTTDRKGLLGFLQGNSPDEASIIPNTLGEEVIATFKRIEQITLQKTGCHVQIIQYQLMPDHFHGILYVRDALPQNYPLGQIISGWKGACSRAFWSLSSSPSSSGASRDSAKKTPLFSPGFNDRILFHEGQLESWIDDRVQVRCHRNLSEQEIQAEVEHYLTLARQGSVLVSPFISPAEKAVYHACYKEKRYMIHLVNRSLDGKFVYPTGADFKACTEDSFSS